MIHPKTSSAPRQPRIRRLGTEAGSTTVEVLLAASIGLVVMGGFAMFNKHQLGTLTNQAHQLSVQGTARNIADLIAREVRRADQLVLVPESRGVRLRCDLDHDGAIGSAPDEDVVYGFSNDSVWRRSADTNGVEVSENLLDGIDATGVEIRFVGADGVELTYADILDRGDAPDGIGAVRRLRLIFSVRRTDGAGNTAVGAAAGLTTDVTLRKRFFVSSTATGVDDAVHANFDVDTFLNSLDPGMV